MKVETTGWMKASRGWLAGACLACLACSLVAPAAHASDIDFAAPLNGWRNTSGDSERYTQDVHYPAVAVSTPEGQSRFALIEGQIRNAPKKKGTSVGTLVVDGTPLPQRVEEDGKFSRPYAFPAGSNGVELRASDGSRKRVQFYDAYSGKTQPKLRVLLAWDTDGTDLDLHVVSPDGAHTWYGERVAPNGGALDVDVTTGYGPEIYSSAAPLKGTYLVYVNYYGSGNSGADMTVAQVTIITNENTPNEKSETIRVPMRKAGELTLVKTFVLP
ncbi:YfaP family protein [Paraburkholderia sediminicola]|uniref:YfaP family protein n=1 Tax=Paraburkholderia sediminicola TaxID=458836 RepID=UPI0038B7D196